MINSTIYQDNILEFDINKREWTEVGNMNYAAHNVGVSEVNFTNFEPWCQKNVIKRSTLFIY